MQHQPSSVDSPPPSRQRLAELVYFEYRSMVMRRLDVTAEWRGLEWTADAACASKDGAADGQACSRCPVTGECLAAAMERTYRDVCDLELMRVDTNRATNHTHVDRSRHDYENGEWS
jgi:hypothetical protein